MNGKHDVTYTLDLSRRTSGPEEPKIHLSDRQTADDKSAGRSIPRIARLMALAIRFDGLVRNETIQDYAELARLGSVTRARITQILKLLQLAPDLQEHILFMPTTQGLNERNLRAIVGQLDWSKQRRMFQKMILPHRT